jgi:hypothetical protein
MDDTSNKMLTTEICPQVPASSIYNATVLHVFATLFAGDIIIIHMPSFCACVCHMHCFGCYSQDDVVVVIVILLL